MNFLHGIFTKDNIIARIISVIAACGLWYYVMTEQNPVQERIVDVKLTQINMPQDIVVFDVPEKVQIKVRGARTRIGEDLEKQIYASVNFKNIVEGQQELPVEVSYDGGQVLSVSPARVSFYADTVSEKNVPVTTRIVGTVSEDMTIGNSVINPPQVTIRGATHRINKVNKVAAPVDVTDRHDSFHAESSLVAVSDDGYDIPGIKIKPEKVAVDAVMVTQMLNVELPVELMMGGNLPDGIGISLVEIAPKTVRLTAPPSVIKKIKTVKTKLVDVSNISGNTSVATELDLPDKVIPENKNVTIRFSVERKGNEAKSQ
ncbi:MAG: CdaR family protein [Acidaminococcaceae bacterium]|nr:CdaR family protein [Acidaminococcaceae bacterium]